MRVKSVRAPIRRALRAVLGPIALMSGALFASLAVAELIARLTWHAPMQPVPAVPTPGLRELKTAEDLAVPGMQGIYNHVFFRTNHAGFRGREYDVEKPPGTFRIVIAGDSVTMGSGVLEEEAYPALVEQALNTRRTDQRYEVLNLGLIGINIHQVMDRIEKLGLPFHPDLIVYGCTLNDIQGPLYRRSMDVPFNMEDQAWYHRFNESRSYLVRFAAPRIESVRQLIRPQRGTYLFELLDNYDDNPPGWAYFLHGLDRLATISRRERIPAVVFLHTSLEYLNVFHPYRRVYGRIAGSAEALGLHAIQSFPVFRGHNEESLWVDVFDAHPNAAGHRLLAQALFDGLERLPPATWQRVAGVADSNLALPAAVAH